jgi:hypothetical protein
MNFHIDSLMRMNPPVNSDYISINDLSDMTVGGQTLYQSFLSEMTEIRLINAVIETTNTTSARVEEERRLYNQERQRRRRSAYDRGAHDRDCEEGEQRGLDKDVLEEKVAKRVARRCARFISEEMRQSRYELENRMVVLEYLLDDPLVYPHLVDYYFKPREAKICAQVVNNVKKELSDVKGVQSTEKLAY